jgi:hypothetical protein
MRLPVRQALASGTLNRPRRPFPIVHAEGDPVVVAEIVFGQITV